MLGLGVEGLEASHWDLPSSNGAGAGDGADCVMVLVGTGVGAILGDCKLGGSGG